MFQAFAKNYAESITLVYYCFTGLIAFAAFAIGNVYLWKRDQKNQKERSKEEREYQERRQEYDRECHERRRKEDREHQDRRYQEESRDHRRREWRQFSDRINADYSELKSKDIPRKISKVKDTFEHMRIHSTVTGLDVLRYMLNDDNYRNLVSESPHLQALREDLHMIFLPLNLCSSSVASLGRSATIYKGRIKICGGRVGEFSKAFPYRWTTKGRFEMSGTFLQ